MSVSQMITNHDLVNRYGMSVSQMITNMFHLSEIQARPSFLEMTYYRLLVSVVLLNL